MDTAQEQKIERLYRRYHRLLRTVAFNATDDRFLAEDAVQNTFLKVIRFVDKIDDENPRRLGRLLTIMCKQAVTELFHAKVRAIGTPDDELAYEYEGMTPELYLEHLTQQQQVRYLKCCLEKMDPKYGIPLRMRYVDNVPIAQIAIELGIPENTVYMRIHRARAKLRESMERW